MIQSGAVGGVGGATPPTLGAELRAAAALGDVAACRRYLGAARLVRFSRDEHGRTALHLAAANGHREVVRLLVSVAAPREVDGLDGAGCTALQRAAASGHEEVIRLVLARGAEVNGQDSVHGNTALHEAAWKGYSRTVRLLASAGADLNRSNAGGFTALHLSCQNGHNQSCRELLLAGCDPDIQNNYGDTALHTAARYGHAGVTRILISAQCRISKQNKNGDTALHISSAMGRRKLTRILLEAGCEKNVRNKQGETSRDIALRKDLFEILDILDDSGVGRESRKSKKGSGGAKKRSKSKVKFEDAVDSKEMPNESKPWSPYGCHYFPDPKNFPAPRLDSLPDEPLKKGEQYYLDLAGNICKGPIGVGYTCYCAPLFKHLEARIERDKKELQKAHFRLRQRVIGLEQKLKRGQQGRRSERVLPTGRDKEVPLPRSRSLEMLYEADKPQLQATRSMDELDPAEETATTRPSVKELVARIQQINCSTNNGNNSESSDEEDISVRKKNPDNEPTPLDFPGDAPPRSRTGVYSPTIVNSVTVNQNPRYIEPIVEIREGGTKYGGYVHQVSNKRQPVYQTDVGFVEPYKIQYYDNAVAERRVLTGAKTYENDSGVAGKSTVRTEVNFAVTNVPDNVDRDTNNDSGYSTKVYGSSKGNSPNLCGKIDGDGLGTSSSLV
ncbi:ankyrin repeat domain-containing protein 6 [Diorhabda sublineata]|uniref:ankyrin repeat domain-containing protein 6 n=1 Tax=Diorhabda sublineata TaxID=1163346 RepID=UPI0024E10AA5|nr:ankyrin repeat domain-containing protein 6 [Diorhabda sublineata]